MSSIASQHSARIVAIDDDPDILALIEAECSAAGHSVTLVEDCRKALATVRSVRPEIVLLDLVMPNGPGEEICRQLRADASSRKTWIVILSAKNSEDDVIKSLDAGADDYLTKPFGFGELTARIRSILRRTRMDTEGHLFSSGALTVDTSGHVARIAGDQIDLTPAQFRLLAHLVKNPGRVFSREALLKLIGGSRS